MKFIHIADIHIGARPEAGKAYSNNREREILDTFTRVLKQCEREKIELLIIAGGLFHRQPLLQELKEVDYLFSKLSVTKVVFIVGDREYLRENTYYYTFQWSPNVYPILAADMTCVQIPSLKLAVYGCSYHQSEVEEKKLLEKMPLNSQQYHILVGHGGDENHMPFDRNDLEALPYHYIALGHQRKPEILVENRIAYAGALEPIHVSDVGKHGYMQGELTATRDGSVTSEVSFVACASREYVKCVVPVEASVTNDALKQRIHELREAKGMQHMYVLELQGKHGLDTTFAIEEYDEVGNIIEIIDNTFPDYDLEALEVSNKDNLLGAYIKSFSHVEEGSIEYMALIEGVRAIEETKKG